MNDNREKIIIEYDMKGTPIQLLWNYISTASGLEEWFADEVTFDHKNCAFSWNGVTQQAVMVAVRNGIYIRFRWIDDVPGAFFEFRISINEITDTTMLTVTDFAAPDDRQDTVDLWNSQIETLRRALGC